MGFDGIVLAAGQGKRMKSSISKVMHDIAGRKVAYYSVCAALTSGADRVVVVCSHENRDGLDAYLVAAFGRERIECVVQPSPNGTGDAAKIGIAACRGEHVCILYGDTPLVQGVDLAALIRHADVTQAPLTVLSCVLANPTGYGRILRGANGTVLAIREHRDATAVERAIAEVNAGIYYGRRQAIVQALDELRPNNDQQEFYLTDIVSILASAGQVEAQIGSADALLGINDREQLELAEQTLLERIRNRHRQNGVTIRGHARIEDAVEIESDCTIESGVELRGHCQIGTGTRIDVGSILTNAVIGQRVTVLPYSVITESSVGDTAQIGPFSHLRPASVIEAEAHIGNFVETKKTRIRRGAKANHLSYLGDGDVGEKANVGAGTIFCNYDGYKKHPTIIGDGAFIGSDSQLVAPVVVGKGAYVATGTTVTTDVPDDALAIGRTRQENKLGYGARLRGRLAAQAGKKP